MIEPQLDETAGKHSQMATFTDLLRTEAEVGGVDEKAFQSIAEQTKKTCPVSQALTGTTIDLEAKLLQAAAAR